MALSESFAQKFILIQENDTLPGRINEKDIAKLNEPLRALAAYYSALGGSGCDQDSVSERCGLTTALGLGEQGSLAHKALLTKYFFDDKAAQQLIKQECYHRPDGASSFSDYGYLNFFQKGKFVR